MSCHIKLRAQTLIKKCARFAKLKVLFALALCLAHYLLLRMLNVIMKTCAVLGRYYHTLIFSSTAVDFEFNFETFCEFR